MYVIKMNIIIEIRTIAKTGKGLECTIEMKY